MLNQLSQYRRPSRYLCLRWYRVLSITKLPGLIRVHLRTVARIAYLRPNPKLSFKRSAKIVGKEMMFCRDWAGCVRLRLDQIKINWHLWSIWRKRTKRSLIKWVLSKNLRKPQTQLSKRIRLSLKARKKPKVKSQRKSLRWLWVSRQLLRMIHYHRTWRSNHLCLL